MNYTPEQWLYYRWENTSNGRYYLAELTQNLFGEWCVRKTWGRKGSRLGNWQHIYLSDYDDGLKYLESICQQRLARGYQVVDG